MIERSVRIWCKGPLPLEKKFKPMQRTRPDPFAGLWEKDTESLLSSDAEATIIATCVLEQLERLYRDRFGGSQMWVPQRRSTSYRPNKTTQSVTLYFSGAENFLWRILVSTTSVRSWSFLD